MSNYKKFATKDGTPIQVQSAIEDGAGKNIQNNYAKQDGYYQELTAGYADNLTPYSTNSGVYQSIPFNFQGTGCGNGETQVDTGSFCQFKEKRGNGIVYNQLVENYNFANGTTEWNTTRATITVTDGIAEVTPTDENGLLFQYKSRVIGHTYLAIACIKTANSYCILQYGNNIAYNYSAPNTWQTLFTTYTETAAGRSIIIQGGTSNDFSPIYVKYAILIDLTKWFNGNIPAYLLSHPEAFFRYYSGPLTYNAGELRFSNARYLKTYGRNQWDEVATSSGYISDSGNVITGYTGRIASTNYIRVIPNTAYYVRGPYSVAGYGVRVAWYDENKNLILVQERYLMPFTSPENAAYMRFNTHSQYGSSTYNNDITVSIYYDGESGYDQYYPYEQLQEVDTGTEQLYWAGTAYDKKGSNGLIERNIASVDLGSLEWGYGSTSQIFYAALPDAKDPTATNIKGNASCAKYETVTYSQAMSRDKVLAIDHLVRLIIKDSAYTDATTFKQAVSGVILYYELATPTTEQGTPFTESVKIDDFGSMSLEDTNGIPQGNLIFYPVDYKAFEDSLINRTNGDVTNIALKSDIIVPDAPSTDGTYVLKATVSSGTVSYEWVEE